MHKITVDKKTKGCPFYGEGSAECFYFNKAPIPLLNFEKNQKYKFSIEASGHQFVIAGDDKLNNKLIDPISTGTFIFTVKSDYPNKLYYGCTLHPYEGAPIIITPNDPVELSAVTLRKTIRGPVALKSYNDIIIIGLETGTFYTCDHEKKLNQVFGLKAILEKQVKLYDFVVYKNRIYSLISGHKDDCLSLIEVSNFDGKEEDFKLYDLFNVKAQTGLLSLNNNILYILADKVLHKINIETSGEYKIADDMEKPEFLTLNYQPSCMKMYNDNLFLFSDSIYRLNDNLYKLLFIPNCVEIIHTDKGLLLIYADNNGNLAVVKREEDKFVAGWKTSCPKGVKSILQHGKDIYLLIANSDNKVELWQLTKY